MGEAGPELAAGSPEDGPQPEEIQVRVRRLATLRAAQRALDDVVEPGELGPGLETGRKLLRRLQALSGEHAKAEILDREEAMRGVDGLLERLSQQLHHVLETAPIPWLCASLAPLAREESGAIRALAAVALEAEPHSDRMLDLLEFLVALLSCDGPPGARVVGRTPLEALPELGTSSPPEVFHAHPDIDEAEQIFGRGAMRLDRDDIGATRERIQAYRRRLGVRRLNPQVMSAAVAYDMAMARRLAELCGDHDSLDALAETVFGADAADPEAAAALRARRGRVRLPPTEQETGRTRLFWQALATFGLSIGLLTLALLLWQRPSVDVIEQDSASSISPYLVKGHLTGDDGVPHFVGTLDDSWNGLPLPERRLVVARIAARLENDGVSSVTLVNGRNAIQARHEDDTLIWVTAP